MDGLFIRNLLLSFFFKLLPEVIRDGRVYIAEPPLYRVDDKKNPFVVNNSDYMNRYVIKASKEYKVGYKQNPDSLDVEWLDKNHFIDFLNDTKSYVDTIHKLVEHYKVNDRLLEFVLEEFALTHFDETRDKQPQINIQHLMNRIGTEFKELYFDDNSNIIRGSIDAKWQEFEISNNLIKKVSKMIDVVKKWMPSENGCLVLRNIKNANEQELSLLGVLKILQKFQPDILHRFKGLTVTRSYLSSLIAGKTW